MILDVTYRSHTFIHSSSCLSRYGSKHTGLPQNCGKMFPVPLRHDKFQNCFRWLRDYGPCGRFWAWDVGCISFLVGKDLFTAWKNAFKFRTGREKLQVKLCFFLEGSPILEATTNPKTTGKFPNPGFRPPGELAISRALGDLLLKNQGLGFKHLSNEKNPGWLGYIGDSTTQLYGDFNKPL